MIAAVSLRRCSLFLPGSMVVLAPCLIASRESRSMDSIVDKYWSNAASFSGSSFETSKPSLEVMDAMALDLVSDLFLNCSTMRSSSLMIPRAGPFVEEEFVMESEFVLALDGED